MYLDKTFWERFVFYTIVTTTSGSLLAHRKQIVVLIEIVLTWLSAVSSRSEAMYIFCAADGPESKKLQKLVRLESQQSGATDRSAIISIRTKVAKLLTQ